MSSTQYVSAGRLKSMLHDGLEIAVLDVREAGQFGESHLLFAAPLPYSRLELDIARLVPRLTVRVVVCDDGRLGIAEAAARRLAALGYTDVSVLEGGTRAWAAAGYALFAGVNVPSKLFGELVEHVYGTPHLSAQALQRMKEAGEDFILLDGRPLHEHHKLTIPGSTCCPNAELPYRIASMVRNPRTKIVVNCAGRTRSIIGAQTLINFGVPNPVYALENGTQGWCLADFDLEYGATRKYPDRIDESILPAQQAAARRLMEKFEVRAVTGQEVAGWLGQRDRTTYLCDVRTPEEFASGSIAGALHAPGGQLVQATDQWIAVRNARIVLIDGGEMVRAPVVAHWLKQLGYEAHVLEGGVRAQLAAQQAPGKVRLPELSLVAPGPLKQWLETQTCAVFDLRPSQDFRKAHIPGSRWSIRPRLVSDAAATRCAIVLVSEDAAIARVAALDLQQAGRNDLYLLEGGLRAWTEAGYPAEATPGLPPDAECIDYLFFVHDRHAGNREAMQRYLAWETGLLAQLDAQDRSAFRFPPHRT